MILFHGWSKSRSMTFRSSIFNELTNAKQKRVQSPCTELDTVQRGADKSLARPGRKQDTANKFGIYSTYFPRSSIHFLIRCSNLGKPLKKIQKFVCPTTSPRQQWPSRRTKNGDISIVFSVQETGSSPTGPGPENRVGDQDTGSPGRPVSSGLQVPGEPGQFRARTVPPWWPSRRRFSFKMSFNCTSRDRTPRW